MAKAAHKLNDAQLPTWDLTDLYPSPTAPQVAADIAASRKAAEALKKNYQGKLSQLSAKELTSAIAAYESLSEILGRLGSYAQLLYASDMTHPDYGRFYQNTNETLTEISSLTVFFSLELNQIPDEQLDAMLKESPALAHYTPWLRDVRLFRPHQLSQSLEELLHEKHVTGSSAWSRLFDETLARMRFTVRGETLGCEQVLHMLSDTDGELRKDAAKALGEGFKDQIHLFTTITNVLAKDKAIEDQWRNYATPMSSRHLANMVEQEVVDALLKAVRQSYPRLSHRYYTLKAKWMGKETLPYWDRNAPLPNEDNSLIEWKNASSMVLDAYGAFSPKLRELGEKFFANDWIDVPARAGKSPGAFAHPTVPSAHPYLLLNYQGRQRDVMTLAHELGHGVHQLLSAGQGALMADTPLTLAETASVFGEQLTFRALLNAESNPEKRKRLLAGKVEDMLNTVVRQIAFCEFERLVHEARREGELSSEDIGAFWLQVQRESLGPAFTFDEEYSYYWAYISHFIHSPFYVYAYAFGDCLVNALYTAYLDGLPNFEEKYLAMLSAGGTLRHKELLAPFGLDASDPAFWQKGLKVIEGFIDELETL